MKDTEPLLTVELRLPPAGSRTRVRELHRQLKAAIVSDRLAPGLRLPATRTLGASLGVGRNTVIAAYDLLLGEGYIEAERGSGHRVAALAAGRSAPTAVRPGAAAPALEQRLAPMYRGLVGSADREQAKGLPYDFRLGVPVVLDDHRPMPLCKRKQCDASAWRQHTAERELVRRRHADHAGFARQILDQQALVVHRHLHDATGLFIQPARALIGITFAPSCNRSK